MVFYISEQNNFFTAITPGFSFSIISNLFLVEKYVDKSFERPPFTAVYKQNGVLTVLGVSFFIGNQLLINKLKLTCSVCND